MRRMIVCVLCLCLCSGCCIGAIGKAVGEAMQEALSHWMLEVGPICAIDESLTQAELAVLQAHGPNPRYLPWFAGAEIARFAVLRLGIAPASPKIQLHLLTHTFKDAHSALWDFLRWLNSPPDENCAQKKAVPGKDGFEWGF